MANTYANSVSALTSRYDLHTHSMRSDGTLTPADLVTRAHAAGIGVLALTDHDVTDGIEEALRTANQLGMSLIAGVEISVTWQGHTVHIVGLNIDATHRPLQEGLARLRAFREWRAVEIGRRLQKKRIDQAYEGARRLAQGEIIGRMHFARFLVDQGYVRGQQQAFRQFLGRGKPGYVPAQWAELSEAVSWIRSAGGRAVVAHPGRYTMKPGELQDFMGAFQDCGGEAIEVISGSHTPEANRRFELVACERGFLASVGSDFHGPEKTWMTLGRLAELPSACIPVWHDWNNAVLPGGRIS